MLRWDKRSQLRRENARKQKTSDSGPAGTDEKKLTSFVPAIPHVQSPLKKMISQGATNNQGEASTCLM